MKKKLIIFGADLMAKMIYFYFSRDSDYEVVAFTVDRTYIKSDDFMGIKLVPFEDIQLNYPPSKFDMFIGIGTSNMNVNREKKFFEAKEKGYYLAKYISPSAICHSEIGENTVVGDMAIINPYVEIGYNNYFWEHVFIGNDSVIGNHSSFSPKSVVGTYSRIEDNVILGTSSVVKTSVLVAKKTLVGAVCYISDDTKEKGIYGEKGSQLYGCISDKINISSAKK